MRARIPQQAIDARIAERGNDSFMDKENNIYSPDRVTDVMWIIDNDGALSYFVFGFKNGNPTYKEAQVVWVNPLYEKLRNDMYKGVSTARNYFSSRGHWFDEGRIEIVGGMTNRNLAPGLLKKE